MLKFERNLQYELRLMPNYFDIKNSIFTGEVEYNSKRIIIYFSYILENDKLNTIKFGRTIKEFISHVFHGFYGTSEGYFICESNDFHDNGKPKIPKFYFASENKETIISPFDSHYNNNYKKLDDIVLYEPRNLFDIKQKHLLSFNVKDHSGYLGFHNLCVKEAEKPVWTEGENKEKILSLYNKILPLNECYEQYKKSNISFNFKNYIRNYKNDIINDVDFSWIKKD